MASDRMYIVNSPPETSRFYFLGCVFIWYLCWWGFVVCVILSGFVRRYISCYSVSPWKLLKALQVSLPCTEIHIEQSLGKHIFLFPSLSVFFAPCFSTIPHKLNMHSFLHPWRENSCLGQMQNGVIIHFTPLQSKRSILQTLRSEETRWMELIL